MIILTSSNKSFHLMNLSPMMWTIGIFIMSQNQIFRNWVTVVYTHRRIANAFFISLFIMLPGKTKYVSSIFEGFSISISGRMKNIKVMLLDWEPGTEFPHNHRA